MLTRIYNKVIELSRSPNAEVWLCVIAFVESSVFMVPVDVLLLPMIATRPDKALRYAIMVTIMSVLGGIFGWILGLFAYDEIVKPLLQFYGELDKFEGLITGIDESVYLLLVTSGLFHLPPIKVMSLISGVVRIPLSNFVLVTTLTRGIRFLLIAWLLHTYGPQIVTFIEKNLTTIFWAVLGVLTTAYITYTILQHLL